MNSGDRVFVDASVYGGGREATVVTWREGNIDGQPYAKVKYDDKNPHTSLVYQKNLTLVFGETIEEDWS